MLQVRRRRLIGIYFCNLMRTAIYYNKKVKA
jgi:hypothetical protein